MATSLQRLEGRLEEDLQGTVRELRKDFHKELVACHEALQVRQVELREALEAEALRVKQQEALAAKVEVQRAQQEENIASEVRRAVSVKESMV